MNSLQGKGDEPTNMMHAFYGDDNAGGNSEESGCHEPGDGTTNLYETHL